MRKSNIPAKVDPLPGSARYYANNPTSIADLAWRLRCMSELNKVAVASALCDRKLMWPPIIMRLTIWLVRKIKGWGNMSAWLMLFSKSAQGRMLAIRTVEDCAHWMLHGQDQNCAYSAGGYDQNEINYIANMYHLTVEEGVEFRAEGSA